MTNNKTEHVTSPSADSTDTVTKRVSIINEFNLGEVIDVVEYDSVDTLAAVVSSESWAPGAFTNGKRLINNLSSIDLLVLDIDDRCSIEEAKEKFKDYKHIIATSRNHQKEKNGVTCDRFRVILFLSDQLTTDRDFKATWHRAKRLWPFIDAACKDSSRFFYASPGVVSINRTGRLFDVSVELGSSADVLSTGVSTSDHRLSQNRVDGRRGSELDNILGSATSGPKGDLWKSTYKFLAEGAEAGTRHSVLVTAVGNMREQGYSKPEVIERIQDMIRAGGSWTQDHLSAVDLKTIDRMYERDMKYPFKPQKENHPFDQNGENQNSTQIVVTAGELLDETFSYLADKDKVKGDPTGIVGLDAMLGGGFRTGELTVLMAQAKTGKNTLYHQLIYKHLETGASFGYASRELNPATEVIPNLLSIGLGLNAWKSSINDTFQNDARQLISRWLLYFAKGYGHFTGDEIEAWFRTLRDLGVTHYLFDHFHYALDGEDYEATTRLIKRLKSLTKELDIHLSLIVQPRALREGESLSLATLRGGAAIGQALDNLLILERVKDDTNVSKLTLEVARHKLAKLGSIYLKYDSETTEFCEVDRQLIHESPLMPKGISSRSYGRQHQA